MPAIILSRTPLALVQAVALAAVCGCAGVPAVGPLDPALDKAVGPILAVPKNAAKTLAPSNDRDWTPDLAVLARAEFDGDLVTVRNIRNCTYRTTEAAVS